MIKEGDMVVCIESGGHNRVPVKEGKRYKVHSVYSDTTGRDFVKIKRYATGDPIAFWARRFKLSKPTNEERMEERRKQLCST